MKPIVLSAPAPRSLDLIFKREKLNLLHDRYEVVETTDEDISNLPVDVLGAARYIIGQPPLSEQTLKALKQLRAVLNVESNLLDNMPYQKVFERGIHVLTTGAVFAVPVAELGLGIAIDLARGITDADLDFRNGKEKWGGEGNQNASLLTGSDVGIIGYGDLGRALKKLLIGFNCTVKVYDPWLPPSILIEQGVTPSSLDEVLSQSDFIFVVAAVTSENSHFLGAAAFASMRKNTRFILLSRAEVVDFDAMIEAVLSGKIMAASDVFPEEPLPHDHRIRSLPNFIRSAHRAGALDVAFKKMGDMVLEDMELMDKGLPPLRCKRAERETVSRMRSKPVSTN
ncbi:MAG: hydroxyacid dehydrogenase [Hyphomicrobiales bacterium]